MDPNSRHQVWSYWTFFVFEFGKHVPKPDVEYNAARWARQGFGSVGSMRVTQTTYGWKLELKVEGAPVQDGLFVSKVREQFRRNFVEKGWSKLAASHVVVHLLAGERDGAQPDQWVELPRIVEENTPNEPHS